MKKIDRSIFPSEGRLNSCQDQPDIDAIEKKERIQLCIDTICLLVVLVAVFYMFVKISDVKIPKLEDLKGGDNHGRIEHTHAQPARI